MAYQPFDDNSNSTNQKENDINLKATVRMGKSKKRGSSKRRIELRRNRKSTLDKRIYWFYVCIEATCEKKQPKT